MHCSIDVCQVIAKAEQAVCKHEWETEQALAAEVIDV